MSAHAMRVLRARLRAAATGVLDPGIGFLQRLRNSVGGAQEAEGDGDGAGSKRDRSGGRRNDAKNTEVEAPKPKGRLLARLVNVGMILVGGMGGGALAYNLLEDLLDQKAAENSRMQATLAEQSLSTATTEEELEEAQARLSDTEKKLEGSAIAAAEKKLEEAQARRAETEKKLEEAQARRIEAEKKLAASIAEYRTTAAEKQTKLDEAVKLLATLAAGERTAKAQPPASNVNSSNGNVSSNGNISSASNAGSKTRPLKTGDCALKTGDASALKDCVENFNR